MKLTLRVDGEPTEVEVDLERRTVRIGGRLYPVDLRAAAGGRVELEIAGESAVVEGWPSDATVPGDGVSVNGEMLRVAVEQVSGEARAPPAAGTAAVDAPPARAPGRPGGTDVVPPMPGRILEVRVKEGDRVSAGAVLFVLEAMKMRNEVTSPVAGTVTELKALPGQNVRAREPLARIIPG